MTKHNDNISLGKLNEIDLVLKGGSPWGFSLDGGIQTGKALQIKSVESSGKADSLLQVGDHVLRINHVTCQSVEEAQELIDCAFRTLTISIWRNNHNESVSSTVGGNNGASESTVQTLSYKHRRSSSKSSDDGSPTLHYDLVLENDTDSMAMWSLYHRQRQHLDKSRRESTPAGSVIGPPVSGGGRYAPNIHAANRRNSFSGGPTCRNLVSRHNSIMQEPIEYQSDIDQPVYENVNMVEDKERGVASRLRSSHRHLRSERKLTKDSGYETSAQTESDYYVNTEWVNRVKKHYIDDDGMTIDSGHHQCYQQAAVSDCTSSGADTVSRSNVLNSADSAAELRTRSAQLGYSRRYQQRQSCPNRPYSSRLIGPTSRYSSSETFHAKSGQIINQTDRLVWSAGAKSTPSLLHNDNKNNQSANEKCIGRPVCVASCRSTPNLDLQQQYKANVISNNAMVNRKFGKKPSVYEALSSKSGLDFAPMIQSRPYWDRHESRHIRQSSSQSSGSDWASSGYHSMSVHSKQSSCSTDFDVPSDYGYIKESVSDLDLSAPPPPHEYFYRDLTKASAVGGHRSYTDLTSSCSSLPPPLSEVTRMTYGPLGQWPSSESSRELRNASRGFADGSYYDSSYVDYARDYHPRGSVSEVTWPNSAKESPKGGSSTCGEIPVSSECNSNASTPLLDRLKIEKEYRGNSSGAVTNKRYNDDSGSESIGSCHSSQETLKWHGSYNDLTCAANPPSTDSRNKSNEIVDDKSVSLPEETPSRRQSFNRLSSSPEQKFPSPASGVVTPQSPSVPHSSEQERPAVNRSHYQVSPRLDYSNCLTYSKRRSPDRQFSTNSQSPDGPLATRQSPDGRRLSSDQSSAHAAEVPSSESSLSRSQSTDESFASRQFIAIQQCPVVGQPNTPDSGKSSNPMLPTWQKSSHHDRSYNNCDKMSKDGVRKTPQVPFVAGFAKETRTSPNNSICATNGGNGHPSVGTNSRYDASVANPDSCSNRSPVNEPRAATSVIFYSTAAKDQTRGPNSQPNPSPHKGHTIVHSSRVMQPQRHNSHSIRYYEASYVVPARSVSNPLVRPQRLAYKQTSDNVMVTKSSYLDPGKKHKVSDPELKAIQKQAVLSYFERRSKGHNSPESNKMGDGYRIWASSNHAVSNQHELCDAKEDGVDPKAKNESDDGTVNKKLGVNVQEIVQKFSQNAIGHVAQTDRIKSTDSERRGVEERRASPAKNILTEVVTDGDWSRCSSPDLPLPPPPASVFDEVLENNEPLPSPPPPHAEELKSEMQNFESTTKSLSPVDKVFESTGCNTSVATESNDVSSAREFVTVVAQRRSDDYVNAAMLDSVKSVGNESPPPPLPSRNYRNFSPICNHGNKIVASIRPQQREVSDVKADDVAEKVSLKTDSSTQTTHSLSRRSSSASNRQSLQTPKFRRKKRQAELECEKLSHDLVNQLDDSRLSNLLVPAPEHKTTADYIEGLFDVSNEPSNETSGDRKNNNVMDATHDTPSPDNRRDDISINDRNDNERQLLPSDSAYFTTSESKAKFLTRYSDDIVKQDGIGDVSDQPSLVKKKEELIASIAMKLDILRTEQSAIKDEIEMNGELGNDVLSLVQKHAKPHELDKYKLHVEELGKIIRLLLSLSGRLARAENALCGLDHEDDTEQKKSLMFKRDKLSSQYEEAKRLKECIDRRSGQVSKFLKNYLTEDEYNDYDHFMKMKSKLIVDSREIDDNIKLGEEQLGALSDSLDS